MICFVLDASVALTWCFPDEYSEKSQNVLSLLRNSEHEAAATWFWPLEILNALLMSERRERITPELTRAFLNDLRTLPVRLDPSVPDPGKLQDLARRFRLTAYDAAYLELARRLNVPLATLDKALVLAAPVAGVMLLTA